MRKSNTPYCEFRLSATFALSMTYLTSPRVVSSDRGSLVFFASSSSSYCALLLHRDSCTAFVRERRSVFHIAAPASFFRAAGVDGAPL